jgi:hypothetical protein
VTDAKRQQARRLRLKEEGLVDIRVEIPQALRDDLKAVAERQETTMKELIVGSIQAFVKAFFAGDAAR